MQLIKIFFLILTPCVLFAQKPVYDDFRSKELNAQQLEQFILSSNVQCIVRMNGNGKDSDGLTIAQERAICEKYNVVFYYIPMRQPFNEWAEEVIYYMFTYKTMIHCHHGYDRTGFIVAYLQMKYYYFSFEDVRKENGWDKYDKYSSQFYPTLRSIN